MFIAYNKLMYNIKLGYYECIGYGSSRQVFDLGNGYVIKVAINRAGIEQNIEEYRISNIDNSGLFAKVVQASKKFKIIVMEKANIINNISYVFKYFNVKNRKEFLNLPQLKGIQEKYNLVSSDLYRESSWGIIDRKIVIIDYGFTKRVKDKYYQWMKYTTLENCPIIFRVELLWDLCWQI